MIRPIALAAVLALGAVPASAQQPATTVRLTLDPMAAPVPSLKYRLLPELRDRQRGNALLLYYRAYSPEWQAHRRTPKYLARVVTSNEKPLHDVKPADLPSLEGATARILKEVDRGARRSYCDWEQNQRLREEGIGMLLPDLQGLRELASLLKLRARQELLAGRYDQAARTLQTGMALGRHVAEGPTLIHSLVGVACATQMLQAVDDWIERPGAPNLYWALTDLPRPLISMRSGLEGERFVEDWLFPGYREWLDDPRAVPPAGTRTNLEKLTGVYELEGTARTWVPLLVALKTYPRAKRFLRQHGRSAAEVEAMSPLQAVFLYEVHLYDVAYDDMRKWANLPYVEAAPHVRQVIDRVNALSKREGLSTLTALLVPAVGRVFATQVRLERKVAALRCVEALRLHAAAHGGKLPAKLDRVTEAPLALDPVTGKSFEYRLEGNKATLTGPAPAGEQASAGNTIRYELTVRNPKGK